MLIFLELYGIYLSLSGREMPRPPPQQYNTVPGRGGGGGGGGGGGRGGGGGGEWNRGTFVCFVLIKVQHASTFPHSMSVFAIFYHKSC